MLSSQKKKQRESPDKKSKSGMFLPEITPTEEDKGVFGDVFNLEELIYGDDDENKNSQFDVSSTKSVPVRQSSHRIKEQKKKTKKGDVIYEVDEEEAQM